MLQRDLSLQTLQSARPGSREFLDSVYALGGAGTVEDIPLLIHFMESPNPEVRCVAAQAIAQIGGASAVTALLDALNQPDIPADRGDPGAGQSG
jgi:HEAT repeat protein